MNTKTVEIRDAGTFIPALMVRLSPNDDRDLYLLARAGFGTTPSAQRTYTLLIHLTSIRCEYDPFSWGDRTMTTAHQHIRERGGFDAFRPGEVVDVQYVLGETDAPKVSEQFE